MPLSPDQDEMLKQNILKGFGAPQMPPAPIGPSSFDVSSMGPNMDTTIKNPPMSAPPPVSEPSMATPPPAAPPMPLPPPATPTGAPAPTDINPKIGSSHPGLTPDEITQYVTAQKAQADKYGPDQEKAVMDEIRKKQGSWQNSLGRRMAGASDAIMQGVARAGNSNNLGRFDEREQNDVTNALKENEELQRSNTATMAQKQGLDQMDHNSPVGRAMLATYGPLLDKLGVPKDKQAAMIPALISSMAPELVKHEDVLARVKAAQLSKEATMGFREDQFDQNQWVKLGDKVNALNAGSRKALGISASNNMRADRLIQTAANKDITPQDIKNLTADLQGIYKGGTPDEMMQKYGNYNTIQQDAGKILGYLSSGTGKANSPEVVAHLKKLALELKQVDNKVIHDNLGINAVTFKPLIEKDPQRWHEMVGAVEATTSSPGEKGGIGGAAPAAQVIDSQAAYDSLPSGATYTGPDGKTRRKG